MTIAEISKVSLEQEAAKRGYLSYTIKERKEGRMTVLELHSACGHMLSCVYV